METLLSWMNYAAVAVGILGLVSIVAGIVNLHAFHDRRHEDRA